ncbi:MAG TPA: hypothetical protein VE326_11350 [Candidatus Binatia bacterium]|nr:hypothetical protein [Candidatus Binatia bacterium]
MSDRIHVPDGAKLDVLFAGGAHHYWSTHCRHDDHDACSATELAPGVPRKPAQCKRCGAACICPCHDTRRAMLDLLDALQGVELPEHVKSAHRIALAAVDR